MTEQIVKDLPGSLCLYFKEGIKPRALETFPTDLGCKTSDVYLSPGEIPEGKNQVTSPFLPKENLLMLGRLTFSAFSEKVAARQLSYTDCQIHNFGDRSCSAGRTGGSHYNACDELGVGNGAFLDISDNNSDLHSRNLVFTFKYYE